MKRNLALCVLIALLLGGCATNPAPTPTAPTAAASPLATPVPTVPAAPATVAAPANTPPGDVAATVNGVAIPMSTYKAQLQTAIASYSQQPGVDPNSPDGQAAIAALRTQVLDWLIDQAIIDQAAAQLGIHIDDAQVDAEVERIRNENPEGFDDWLKSNGFTEETFRLQTRSDLLGAAVRDQVTKDVGGKVEQVHVRQILVDTQEQARAVLDQLRAGTSFESLARRLSKDEASRDNGGDLGFVPKGVLAESVEQVAFALQPGQISDPVQSPFGWHIIQVLEHDPAREVSPEILTTLRQDAFMRWLDGERNKAQIQRFIAGE